MARYQVNLVYDGTHFSGFQRQANRRTVQGVVEDALRQLGWPGSSILAAGRTDTGVHAYGQVIAFDLEWKHHVDALGQALNACLPSDVACHQVKATRADFHPRYAAQARSYRYQIFLSGLRDPLRERYAWRVWPVPDVNLLHQTAQLLTGVHDFAAFGTPPQVGRSTLRQIYQADWHANADELQFNVTGNAFLYRMVRRLVGLQIRIAQNRMPLTGLSNYLEHPDEERVLVLAPPQGLFLMEVRYPSEDC